MPVIDNVITDEVIEGRMYDLIARFCKAYKIIEREGDITIEGYPQDGVGYFYLAKYRGKPFASILHYKSELVMTSFADSSSFN